MHYRLLAVLTITLVYLSRQAMSPWGSHVFLCTGRRDSLISVFTIPTCTPLQRPPRRGLGAYPKLARTVEQDGQSVNLHIHAEHALLLDLTTARCENGLGQIGGSH